MTLFPAKSLVLQTNGPQRLYLMVTDIPLSTIATKKDPPEACRQAALPEGPLLLNLKLGDSPLELDSLLMQMLYGQRIALQLLMLP